jgi:flagellar basal body-associated protein FliL
VCRLNLNQAGAGTVPKATLAAYHLGFSSSGCESHGRNGTANHRDTEKEWAARLDSAGRNCPGVHCRWLCCSLVHFRRWLGRSRGYFPRSHSSKEEKTAFVTFGDVVVNLHEERLTRYLRLKIVLEVEESEEKKLNELLNKRKAPLKSWLISYLADRTLEEVRGTVGINRIRREIRDHFNEMLYPDGREVIRQVHFEEFTVQ